MTRLNDWLDDRLKSHLPDWLYKQVTFQPDRALHPRNNKLASAYSLLLIVAAIIALIITLK
jgi:hypothetical protein